ncbi:MAG TPA: thiosulfohydrolase SoxB [Rhodoblastus sp.]|nr:thiosulfohydrolase SoxB [Rhodoblastus sp.]
MNRREFLNVLAAAGVSGMAPTASFAQAEKNAEQIYDAPAFGNVSLLHITDCHAQLMPIYFREPNVNIGVAGMAGKAPHVVGREFLKYFEIPADTRLAHAFTYLDFERYAGVYGKVGGFAHLSTLVKRIRAQRPGALLLDGGDSWQGSGAALWTKGQDMIDAQLALGVDIMTLHWESTYGQDRVLEVSKKDFAGKIEIVAQNIKTADFGDPVFKPYVIRNVNGVKVAVIGQAFPYTLIAHPRYIAPDWTFGIQEQNMQKTVDAARGEGAQVVVVLSHNGMDVDLKMASRVTGVDAIFGGHTHDGMPRPTIVANPGGKTIVMNGGSNSKFLGVLDLDVKNGKIADFRYKLLPVFANLLPADAAMQALIQKSRAPYESKLNEKLVVSEGLLYRRGNFNGSFDQLILDALMQEKNAEIALSPGFRWGTTIMPGEAIAMENLLDQTAIVYPYVTLTEMTGAQIKGVLEDVCDNLFNPDPYYQQGGDMVRVGGMSYSCDPTAEAARDAGGEPIWDLVARNLRARKTLKPPVLNVPTLKNVDGNPGMAV